MRAITDQDRLAFLVHISSAYNMLDWSGDNWPQPKAFLCTQTINWDEMRLEGERPVNSTDVNRAFYEQVIAPSWPNHD